MTKPPTPINIRRRLLIATALLANFAGLFALTDPHNLFLEPCHRGPIVKDCGRYAPLRSLRENLIVALAHGDPVIMNARVDVRSNDCHGGFVVETDHSLIFGNDLDGSIILRADHLDVDDNSNHGPAGGRDSCVVISHAGS